MTSALDLETLACVICGKTDNTITDKSTSTSGEYWTSYEFTTTVGRVGNVVTYSNNPPDRYVQVYAGGDIIEHETDFVSSPSFFFNIEITS